MQRDIVLSAILVLVYFCIKSILFSWQKFLLWKQLKRVFYLLKEFLSCNSFFFLFQHKNTLIAVSKIHKIFQLSSSANYFNSFPFVKQKLEKERSEIFSIICFFCALNTIFSSHPFSITLFSVRFPGCWKGEGKSSNFFSLFQSKNHKLKAEIEPFVFFIFLSSNVP